MILQTRDKQREYMLAGRALFTIKNKDSGNRFTFKVSKKETENAQTLYFIKVLSGPSNDSDYTYLGTVFLNDDKGEFKSTRGSQVSADAPSFKAFKWLFNMLQAGKELPPQVEFYHEGRCGRCGRRLTVPESIESGFGPECISMI